MRAEAPYRGLLEHAARPRTVGVLLVRKGGYAAGVFAGTELLASKVGSRLVQGRSAAGGWSQQRFARRREGQAREAYAAAADNAVRILVPELNRLDAVVTGGDRPALAAVLEDPRLGRGPRARRRPGAGRRRPPAGGAARTPRSGSARPVSACRCVTDVT